MRYLILGPLEVIGTEGHVAIPAAKQRALLAILLLHAGSPVPGWRITEDLWPEPPVSARKVIQTYVSKLRQVLPVGTLVTTQTGYLLNVGRDELDVTRFQDLIADATGLPPREEAARLRSALALWRGGALEDFVDEPFARSESPRLEAMRLAAHERCIDIDLLEGRSDSVLAELLTLVQANPLNERLRGQLMLALYRSGRQDDALRAFREGRHLLIDELGVEPTPELCRLEQAILRHDPTLNSAATASLDGISPPAPGAGHPAPGRGRPRSADRSGVPGFTTSFVGRAGDLDRLRSILREHRARLVMLTGPAGGGKTRLAVELAESIASEYDAGWAFVDLTRVVAHAGVAAEISATLGIIPVEPADASSALCEGLRSREQLLVLDNFEHVLPAIALVRRLVDQAPLLTVLVTSRTAVPGIEHEFPVSPLAVPAPDVAWGDLASVDSVSLFVDRARAARPDFNLTESTAPQVALLCGYLDGLPLAIELAAARVDMLSPRALLARLDRRLDLLATDSGVSPEHHRSLRAAVEWSYQLLDEDSRTILTDLAVFVGGFTLDTAERVVSPVKGLLLDVVKRLIHANLIRSSGSPGDEPRFAMLDTIREYGRGSLVESGRADDVRAAHALAYLRLAEEAEEQLRGPEQMRWLDLLQAELPNIREAVVWSTSHGDPNHALITVARLWRFWQARGLTHEARARLRDLLTTSDLSERSRAAGHLAIAQCAFVQGDLEAVKRAIAECLPYFRRDRDAFSAGFALLLLGTAFGRGSDPDEGAALLREALALAEASGEEWLRSCGLGYLGMVLSAQREYDQARLALEEGLRGIRELSDARLIGWFLIGLGRTALAAGDPLHAHRRFEEALTWTRRVGDAWSEAWALQGVASAALARGELPVAFARAVESFRPARDARNRAATAAALRILATVAHQRSNPTVAAELLGAASAVYDGAGQFWTFDADGVPILDTRILARSIDQDAVAEHWARGRALTTEEAVALASNAWDG